jgi:hypothetical protein
MKKILLAGVMLLALGSAASADVMPDALQGHWTFVPVGKFPNGTVKIDPDNIYMRSSDPDFTPYSGYDIGKDKYSIMDFDCIVLKVEKLADTLYTVQADCKLGGDNGGDPSLDNEYTATNEFELLKSGKLLVNPVGS